MLYVLLVVLWYADHSYVANPYATAQQCATAQATMTEAVNREYIDGVESVAVYCVPSSNPQTENEAAL